MLSYEGMLESVANPRVKEWSKLKERKYRQREAKFILEGVHLVSEALQANWPLEAIAFDAGFGVPEELERIRREVYGVGEGELRWFPVSPDVIVKCSDTGTPQPVIAIARKRELVNEQLLLSGTGPVIVLDGVQDPGNVGTIVRSAAAFGASAVVLGKGTVDLYNSKTLRATMGALFHVPILEADLTELLPAIAETGARIVGTSLDAKQTCYDYKLQEQVWLVFGNEGAGMSAEVSELVHDRIIVPMTGYAESLNVAMAASVLLFEAQRQRDYGAK